jgi:hypothetical protein
LRRLERRRDNGPMALPTPQRLSALLASLETAQLERKAA